MHVCRSAVKRKRSGDTERSSHQAAAHMGQGKEGKGGRVSYRIAYSNLALAEGGISPRLALFPLLSKNVSASIAFLVCFKIELVWPPSLGPPPFPLVSHFSSLLFLLSFPRALTHTHSVSLSSLLFSYE